MSSSKMVDILILMDILKKLTDKIQKYFILVESHEAQIQNWIKDAKKPVHSITNQGAILRAVLPNNSVLGTPFEKFEGFRESLIEAVSVSVHEELFYLEEIRDKINASNEKLLKEEQVIEKLYFELQVKKPNYETQLNPCCPSLKHIVIWCCDVWCYYHTFYLQLSQSLVNLNFEDQETVEALVQSVQENLELKKHINKIRNFNFSNFEFLT